MHVYLDWNIINNIEHKNTIPESDRIIYERIEQLIINKTIIVPYSNAHIHDLLRGYEKNKNYISGHLSIIERLSKNLCIVQYWGNEITTWHFRNVNDFFYSILEEKDSQSKSFKDLLSWDETILKDLLFQTLESMPIGRNFKNIFKENPVFSKIFPISKVKPNILSLCEDIYNISIDSNKDYSIYKALRNYINASKTKINTQQKHVLKTVELEPNRALFNLEEHFEKYTSTHKSGDNPAYHKLIMTYCKIDMRGFKSDDKFSNLIDDALHSFYGGHCEYFITIDEKCRYKASETYKELKIETVVMNPVEFIAEVEKGIIA